MVVATGQLGPKAPIYVWDPNNLEQPPLAKFQGDIIKGVACLAFSPSGKFLAAAGVIFPA